MLQINAILFVIGLATSAQAVGPRNQAECETIVELTKRIEAIRSVGVAAKREGVDLKTLDPCAAMIDTKHILPLGSLLMSELTHRGSRYFSPNWPDGFQSPLLVESFKALPP